MPMPRIKSSLNVAAMLMLTAALTGCQSTLYYNPRYLDVETANANFQQDTMRCRAYANSSIPMPAPHQVQNYDYQITGKSYTRRTFGGYETTYQADITPVPSTADSIMSLTSTIMQIAAQSARENRYQDCLSHLGWTTNINQAFPNEKLMLDPPINSSGQLSDNFYTPVIRKDKMPLSVAYVELHMSPLTFQNYGNMYNLDVNNFQAVFKKELEQHFKQVTTRDTADITCHPSIKIALSPTEKRCELDFLAQFKDKGGRDVQWVRYADTLDIASDKTQLDELATDLAEKAFADMIRRTGWFMHQTEFRSKFANIVPDNI